MHGNEDPFKRAVSLLPARFAYAASALSEKQKQMAEEFRLRIQSGLSVVICGREISLQSGADPEDIREVVVRAAQGSLHSVSESIANGFITVSGGIRVGICGAATQSSENRRTAGCFTSVAIRIARQTKCVSDSLYNKMREEGILTSTLIVSPPGYGKTTLLRELTRRISDDGFRVGVADERGEISGACDGAFAFELGRCTDILCGTPKTDAALILLRTMSPQLIVMDEITAAEDIAAVEQISNCGVAVYASIHAIDGDDLRRRNGFERIKNLFFRYIVITLCERGERKYLFNGELF